MSIDLAILGLLHDHDLHGYELRRRINEIDASATAISFGALYPALARLERGGTVKVVDPQAGMRPAMPLTGSLSGEASAYAARRRDDAPPAATAGRARKVYSVTPAGRDLLGDLLDDPATDDKSFRLKLALCHLLPPARRLAFLERRHAQLATALLRQRSSNRAGRIRTDDSPGARFRQALRDRDLQNLIHDIAWLERLIADELGPTDNHTMTETP